MSLVVRLHLVSLSEVKPDKLIPQLLVIHRKQMLARICSLLPPLLGGIRVCFDNH